MALIQTSVLVSNIKGSIGGTTFSMNRAGLTAKKRLVGKRLLNTKQAAAINFSLLSTYAWNQLSNANKILFNNYALANASTDRYGVTKQLTGYQWFKLLNQNNLYYNGSNLTSPPAHAVPLPPPTFTINTSTGRIIVTWSTPVDTTNYYYQCFSTAPLRGNARLQRGAYRLTDIRSLDVTHVFDLTDAWDTTHNLTFTAYTEETNFNFNVLIFPIKKTSLVNGTAQTAIGFTFG